MTDTRRCLPRGSVCFASALLLALLPLACTNLNWQGSKIEPAVYRRAESDRAVQLEREVARMRIDLARAEEALVAVESGLRGKHTRADAVSSLAEARIRVARATREAPWRASDMNEAHSKLDEAGLQIQQGNPGAALFFVYRAQRIAELVQIEAQAVAERKGALFVDAPLVNLRAGPSEAERVVLMLKEGTPVFAERSRNDWVLVRGVSGQVGWVHHSLLRIQ